MSIESNIEHLRYLGLKPGNCADAWKQYFKCVPWGKCQVCKFKIRINRVIAKIIGNKFHGSKDWPPVFFIFGTDDAKYVLPMQYNSPDANNYYSAITNKQKTNLLVPVCFRCWINALSNNYHANGLPINTEITQLMCCKQSELSEEQQHIKLQLEIDYSTEYRVTQTQINHYI